MARSLRISLSSLPAHIDCGQILAARMYCTWLLILNCSNVADAAATVVALLLSRYVENTVDSRYNRSTSGSQLYKKCNNFVIIIKSLFCLSLLVGHSGFFFRGASSFPLLQRFGGRFGRLHSLFLFIRRRLLRLPSKAPRISRRYRLLHLLRAFCRDETGASGGDPVFASFALRGHDATFEDADHRRRSQRRRRCGPDSLGHLVLL